MMLMQGNILPPYRRALVLDNRCAKNRNKKKDEIIQREPLAMAKYLLLEANARPYRRVKMPILKNQTLYTQAITPPIEIASSLLAITSTPHPHIGRTSERVAKT